MRKIKNYILQEQIGVGKFGVVFKGKNLDTDETVAIKLIKKSLLNTPYKRELLLSEVRIMKKLKAEGSPNIVQLIECMETAHNFYIILEYCNGGDLKQYLNKQKKLDEQKSIAKFKEILNGMKTLLKNNIIHRDIKTANIFIHNDTFKIGDFGFATDNLTDMPKLGTPLYMAPELLNAKPYTQKVDVWSLGVILYQLLLGDFPFKATSEEKLKEVIEQGLDLEVDNNKELNPELVQLLMKIFERDQEQRITLNELVNSPLFKDQQQQQQQRIRPQVEQSAKEGESNRIQWHHSFTETTAECSEAIKESNYLSNFKSLNLQSLQSNALQPQNQQQEIDSSANQQQQQYLPGEVNQETMIVNQAGECGEQQQQQQQELN